MIVQKHTISTSPIQGTFPGTQQDLLFFDIETTGFSPSDTALYMIGAVFFDRSVWMATQWLCESRDEEDSVLSAFLAFSQNFSVLIHFNGEGFDLPYLEKKAEKYGLHTPFRSMTSIDIYRKIRPFRKLLNLSHMNQKSLELFLDIQRSDRLSGKELISVYQIYEQTHPDECEKLLLLHNLDDLRGMLALTSLLAYPALFGEHRFSLENMAWMDTPDGQPDLALELSLETPVPKPVSLRQERCYLIADGSVCRLLVHAFEGELKYFLPDYQNYYYLPREDQAVHKSVGSALPSEFRMQATAHSCYLRKYGLFLPQKAELFHPLFQKDYKDPQLWFECTEQFMDSPSDLLLYIKSLISI